MAKKTLKTISEIYGWGYTFDMVNEFMSSASEKDTVIIPINSYGGSVMEGIAIHNIIKGSRAKTEAHIIGYAASMGTVVSASADTVVMPDNGYYMIHEASVLTRGGTIEHESATQLLSKINDDMANIYAKKTGMDKSKIVEMMKKTTWLTAKDALEMGFVDRLSEGSEIHASAIELGKFDNVPSALLTMSTSINNQNENRILEQCYQLLNKIQSLFMSKKTTPETKDDDALAKLKATSEAANKAYQDALNAKSDSQEKLSLEDVAKTVNDLSAKVSNLKAENQQLKEDLQTKDDEIAELGKKPEGDHENLGGEDTGGEKLKSWQKLPENIADQEKFAKMGGKKS